MTAREKIDAAVADLIARRVRKSTAAPLLYRLAWRLGIPIVPPLFQNFFVIVVLQGLFFSAFMFVVVSIGPRNHLREALGLALACGLFFGLIMAGYYRAYARILKLPKWSNYVPDQFAEDEDADW